MNKKAKKTTTWIIGIIIIIVVCLVNIILAGRFLGGKKSDTLTVEYNGKVIGLKCTDRSLVHPAVAKTSPLSFTNTITANFQNNKLLSIMYQYDGVYHNSDAARAARDYAESEYNLILIRNYNVKADIFSHVFRYDDEKMAFTVTANGDKVTGRTAPYFLLEVSDSFPKTLDELEAAYTAKNISCERSE